MRNPPADGTVAAPAFQLPLSSYLSPQARERVIAAQAPPAWTPTKDTTIEEMRAAFDEHTLAPKLKIARELFATEVESQVIDGVRVDIVTPSDGVSEASRDRVLINMHGGGFRVGGGMGGLVEAIPVAATTKIKVVTIDYRMGPEHKHPAAVDDVETVYRHLLKTHEAKAIGIYGCSAGGVLTCMALARFQAKGLPTPGSIAMISACGEGTFGGGDSIFTSPAARGAPPPSAEVNPPQVNVPVMYLGSATGDDPTVSPVFSDEIMAKFPPALVLTATRDFELSAATYTHRRLLAAGIPAKLVVWDGLGHGFTYDVDLPESAEAFATIAKFFNFTLA